MYQRQENGTFKLCDRREMLKIKIKSLGAEIKIIRKEESKTFGVLHQELRDHRLGLRQEAYKTLIAYQIIRGKFHRPNLNAYPDRIKAWGPAIDAMVKKYGPCSTDGIYFLPLRLDRKEQKVRAEKKAIKHQAFLEKKEAGKEKIAA